MLPFVKILLLSFIVTSFVFIHHHLLLQLVPGKVTNTKVNIKLRRIRDITS